MSEPAGEVELPDLEKPGDDERERRGAGVPLAWPAAAPAARSAVSISLDAFLRSTGLNVLLATKTGLLTLVMAGATVGAGMTFVARGRGPAAARGLSSGESALAPAGPAADAAAQAAVHAARSRPQPAYQPSSLDYLSQANPRLETQDAPAPAGAAPAPPAQPDNSNAPAAAASPNFDGAARAKLAPTPGMAGASGGQTALAFKPLAGAGDGVGAGFQPIYRAPRAGSTGPMPGSARPTLGAARRTTLAGGRGALGQARVANRLSQSANRTPNMQAAAATASTPFDGANAGIAAQAVSGGGGAIEGPGAKTGSGGALADVKETPPPPPVVEKENKSPWQNLVYAGIGAILLGMVLLMLAGRAINQAKAMAATNPAGAAALFGQAKMLAGGAAAMGVAAAGAGGVIMQKYGQQGQGLMFMLGGGALAAQAVKVMMDADEAEKQAKKEIDKAQTDLGKEVADKNANQLSSPDSRAAADSDATAQAGDAGVDPGKEISRSAAENLTKDAHPAPEPAPVPADSGGGDNMMGQLMGTGLQSLSQNQPDASKDGKDAAKEPQRRSVRRESTHYSGSVGETETPGSGGTIG